MKRHVLLLTGLVALSSCGGDGGESIFLYFINAYSGADNVTIIGPTGPVVQGAKFGDRVGVDRSGSSTVCASGQTCTPAEFDRNLGGDFTAVLDGAPQTFEFSYPLFSLYPQETATLLFAGRNQSGTSIETHLVRHTQTISEGCVITFINALSLDNDLTLENEAYDIVPEFKLTAAQGDFVDERNRPFPTQCGIIDDTSNPIHVALTREVFAKVEADPWFFYSDCEEDNPGSDQSICPIWADRGTSKHSKVYGGPAVSATPNSVEYYKCVQSAISFEQPMGGGGGAMGQQQECPDNPTWADVNIDFVQLAECQRPISKDVKSVAPSEERLHIFTIFDKDFCRPTFRIRTPRFDSIFGPKKGKKAKGTHQKGDLVEMSLKIGPGNEYFVSFMGRPVNPIIWRWESGTSIANLNDFPYSNGQDARIGDY